MLTIKRKESKEKKGKEKRKRKEFIYLVADNEKSQSNPLSRKYKISMTLQANGYKNIPVPMN